MPSQAPTDDDDTSEPNAFRPVYPREGVVESPLAARLCEALHTRPAARRARCCQRPPPAVDQIAAECTRMLSAALADGAVKLTPEAVEACVAAVPADGTDCEGIARLAAAPPGPCAGLLVGTRADGASCRSSLECVAPLRCHGVGPTQAGQCGAALPEGGTCTVASDPLAVFIREPDLDGVRPPCQGWCAHQKCRALAGLGEACLSNPQCGPGRACVAQRCVESRPAAVGEPCTGACVPGARCVGGRCITPKPDGEACAADLECRSACLPRPGAAGGDFVCQPYCTDTFVMPPGPGTVSSPAR